MKNHFIKNLLAVVVLMFHVAASADDTDLFVGLPPNPGDLPNVLFIIDNTANWNNAFTNERAALRTVLAGLPVNANGSAKFRVGFMLFTETGGSNSGVEGGYVRVAIRDLNTDNKALYVAFLDSLDKLADKSNGGKLGVTMTEAYRYFAGLAPFAGNNKTKTDYAGNTSGTAANNAVCAIPNLAPNKNALESKAATLYNSPVIDGSCGKNYIIYISNGAVQDNTSDTATAKAQLAEAGGDTVSIPLSPSGSQDNVGDEWARYLRKSSLAVRTYTIDVDKVTSGQGPGWSALLQSMATQSNAKYFDVNSSVNSGQEIAKAVSEIFSEIQSVNSVFAAVSLPVSVNTQGTYRNQVYIGMFRPDVDAWPRWAGNMKQFKLGFINNVLKLQDADSKSAINVDTGFITECARSFWTPNTLDTYWAFSPSGGCIDPANSDASNYPDGNVVDKGAQAYKTRNMSARPVKTCNPVFASCTTLIDFDSTSATQARLGAASTDERDALINWAKGLNPDLEGNTAANKTAGTPVAPYRAADKRPSVHGDVVHSRPVAINFGTELAPKVVVFYGGNDGVLRAINGNRDNDSGSTVNNIVSASTGTTYTPGQELFAFLPPEFYSKIKRIRDNNIELYFPGTTAIVSGPKPYGLDGPVSAFKDASRAYIYSTMRRGGRALYAFNVNVTDPANITLKWKKGCPNPDNDTDCTTGFDGIGQTWSSPKALYSSNYGSTSPLIMMGGGYDNCEDVDANTCATTKGNKIYLLDADTGALLNTFNTERGVVADIVVVPEIDGTAKHAYAVDLGGNVYRINIGVSAPGSWTITKIAALGCDTTSACTSNRKFMFAPDVLEDNGAYILLLGSGDREKPLNSNYYPLTTAVANYFFKFEDRPSDPNWLANELTNGVCGAAVICKNSLYPITTNVTPTVSALATKKGWYLGLRPSEQVVTSAITVFDNVTFSTHIPLKPVRGACTSDLGIASVYNISYKNAKSSRGGERYQTVAGGGLPPSPVAGNVTLDNGTTVPFCIGCSPDSPLEGGTPTPPNPPVTPKARVYWYIEK